MVNYGVRRRTLVVLVLYIVLKYCIIRVVLEQVQQQQYLPCTSRMDEFLWTIAMKHLWLTLANMMRKKLPVLSLQRWYYVLRSIIKAISKDRTKTLFYCFY